MRAKFTVEVNDNIVKIGDDDSDFRIEIKSPVGFTIDEEAITRHIQLFLKWRERALLARLDAELR